MYKALVGEREVEVDVVDIAERVDDILHKNLTDKTGITVDHDKIVRFVISIIDENNTKEEEFTRQIRELEEVLKKREKIEK